MKPKSYTRQISTKKNAPSLKLDWEKEEGISPSAVHPLEGKYNPILDTIGSSFSPVCNTQKTPLVSETVNGCRPFSLNCQTKIFYA